MMAAHDRTNYNDLSVISYNCDGFKTSSDYVKQLLNTYKPDFLFLQETWLLDNQINLLGDLNDNYLFSGVSGCEPDKMLKGRPYGGVAILWTNNIAQHIMPIHTHSKRITGCKYMCGNEIILFLTVYMPCDNQSITVINDEYVDLIQEVQTVCENINPSRVIIGGDWNTSINRNNAQTNVFKRFLDINNLDICWNSVNAIQTVTYDNNNLGHQSCIDHFVTTMNVFDNITNCVVLDSVDNLSCHKPVLLQFKFQLNRLHKTSKRSNKNKTAWHKVNNDDIVLYQQRLNTKLSLLNVPICIKNCSNVLCNDTVNTNAICKLCSDLISCLIDADKIMPKSAKRKKILPYWSEQAEPFRQVSLWWHWLWKECGSPREGEVASIMRSTRAKYHLIVKTIKKKETSLRFSRMAESISCNNSRDLFNEVRRASGTSNFCSVSVDGKNTPEEITDLFYEKYNDLYHKVPTNPVDLDNLKKQIESNLISDDNVYNCFIDIDMVEKAFASLKCNKTDGDSINTNLLQNSSHTFKSVIVLLFNSMLVHGFTANDLLLSTLVSIPKNLRASLTSSTNYRGIALCSNIAKALDSIFLTMYSDRLMSSNAQYAYKEKHGSVLCTLMLKETAKYFINRNSDVYCCLLDASKAFDCVKYDKLFLLLLERKLPPLVIRLLLDSYTRQSMCIKWDGCLSNPISVANGVKQGGVLSPILFSVYYDVLINRLMDANVGCKLGPDVLNTFVYADDVTLISPSRAGLQTLVNTCLEYSQDYDIKFNQVKTKCIKFSMLAHNVDSLKCISMYDTDIPWELTVNHLGNTLRNDLRDIDDVNIKIGQFYSQFNKLVANFSSCNRHVLSKLFYTYCNSFYGSQAWDLSKPCVVMLYTAWNKAVRRLLRLPFKTHCNLLGPILGIPHIKEQVAHRFLKMYNSMLTSENSYVRNMATRCTYISNSCIGSNVLFLYKYGKEAHVPNISVIIDCIDGNLPSNFTKWEIDSFIEDLCCS